MIQVKTVEIGLGILMACSMIMGLLYCVFKYHEWQIRKQVYATTPQIPVRCCEKGHMYPQTAGLYITVPEIEERIELCPFCYLQNMKSHMQVPS